MSTVRQESYTRWLILAGVLLGACSLAYPRTLLDSPLSTYIGRIILEGGAPYRDAWDVRAPGVFFAYALQMASFGESAVALRVFDVLWQLLTAITLSAIASRLQGRKLAGAIAGLAYVVAYFSQDYWNWAEPDTFLSLPLALAFFATVTGLERRRTRDWIVVGLLVGIATLFKVPYGLFGILPLIAVLVTYRAHVPWLLRCCTGLALGFAAPLAASLFYFWRHDALGDFLASQFIFAPAYLSRVHAMVGFGHVVKSALRPAMVPVYAMTVVVIGSFVARRRGESSQRRGELLLVGWLAVAVVALVLHGSFLGYHYLPMFAPISVLFAGALSSVSELRAPHRRLFRVIIALVSLALLAAGEKIVEHVVFTTRVLAGYVPDAPWRDLGRYIASRTAPGQTIFVWGNVPLVYMYAERHAASRFICTAYLSVEVPRLAYRTVLLKELEARQPVYFVKALDGSITPTLPDSRATFEEFPALREMIATRYTLERKTARYELYRRATP